MMTFQDTFQHGCACVTDRVKRVFKSRSGTVSIEFAVCSLVFIPFFLGTSDYLRVAAAAKWAEEVGSSALRAVVHVPEYDQTMRTALASFCDVNRDSHDTVNIEIVSANYDGIDYNIDWVDMPCGSLSSDHEAVTTESLNSNFRTLGLQSGESITAVKVSYIAQSLEDSKYFYGPKNHIFEFFDAASPRIANSVVFTTENLFDLNSYEY